MYYIKNQKKKNLEAILTLNEWQKVKKLIRMLIPVFLFFFSHKWKNWGQQKWGNFPKVLRSELNQPGPNSETQTFMVPSVRQKRSCDVNSTSQVLTLKLKPLWYHL